MKEFIYIHLFNLFIFILLKIVKNHYRLLENIGFTNVFA